MRGVLATATLPDREFWEGTKTRARNGESSAESGFAPCVFSGAE